MNKVGYIMLAGIIGISIVLCTMVPNPMTIFPIVATSSWAIVFTAAVSLKLRSNKKSLKSSDRFLNVTNLENKNNDDDVIKNYELIHSMTKKPVFRGEHRIESCCESNIEKNKVKIKKHPLR